jgi:hypothetical protein
LPCRTPARRHSLERKNCEIPSYADLTPIGFSAHAVKDRECPAYPIGADVFGSPAHGGAVMKPFVLSVGSAVCLLATYPTYAGGGSKTELDIEMFYQFSASDNDAEVTIGIEMPEHPIDSLAILAPDEHTVARIRSRDRLGLAEVELESAEPSVEAVQRAYPEGVYRFSGWSVDGTLLHGRARITHDVVGAPDFFNFSPCDEEVDPRSWVTIAWNSVAGADGGYEIIIEQDDTGANLRITQAADRSSFVIPEGFLAPGLEYEIEMKSVTAAGNKTSASCEFSTQE